MKQYKYNRIIAVILCMILSISAVVNSTSYEVKAAEMMTNADGCYYMETKDDTPLRAEPEKKAAKVDTLPAGTLVYVVGMKVNSHGNVWYQIAYYDQAAYCYSEHLTEHVHDYVYNDTDDGSAVSVCACGAIDPSGVQQTEVLTAGSAMLAYAGITVIAAILASKGEVGTATKNLVYGTEEVLAAVGVCGVRYIDKLGHYIPIRINEAGVAISITVDEFKQYMSEKHADTDSSDSGAKYYPAMLLSSAKGSDSLFVPLYGKEMNMEEACDYVDATMALSGVFDNYWKFAEQVRFCNVYTTERADAEMLCQKVVECPKNAIVTYGTSNPLNPGESETNAAWSIAGSYEHFRLHNAFERGHKACTHIFFGEMLDRLTKSVYSF